MQTSPWFEKIASAAIRAARSRSGQSSNTMWGDLPPHSSQTRLRFDSPEYVMKRLPVAVEPVKATQSTSGCRPSARPATGPAPQHLERAGRDAGLLDHAASRIALRGRLLGGLEDDAVAGRQCRRDLPGRHQQGVVQGTTAATTPTGSRVMVASALAPVGAISS